MNGVQAGRLMVFNRMQQKAIDVAFGVSGEFLRHYDKCQCVSWWGYGFRLDLDDMLAALRGKSTV